MRGDAHKQAELTQADYNGSCYGKNRSFRVRGCPVPRENARHGGITNGGGDSLRIMYADAPGKTEELGELVKDGQASSASLA
jgi:hypothetical protein